MNSARLPILMIITVMNLGKTNLTLAQLPPPRIYQPLPINTGETVNDVLSYGDIPTGDGGFARDYSITLAKGEQILIELTSDEFDTIVTFLGEDGQTIAENDDAPDGSTNSLLFTQIQENGKYIIRVRSFALTGGGHFSLRVAKLKEVN